MQGGAVASTQVIWTIRFSRNTSFWNLLFLLPLVMTAALSTVGLALPSKFKFKFVHLLFNMVTLQTFLLNSCIHLNLVACGEKMGFQITLFLTLAIYTTQFQDELPVWEKVSDTPYMANTVIVCIVVNALSCLITAIALMIYHLGEEQVFMPSESAFKVLLFFKP